MATLVNGVNHSEESAATAGTVTALVTHTQKHSTPIESGIDIQSRFLPVMSIATALERYRQIEEIFQKVMVEDEDYGKVPGARKPSLMKPGAEKLCNLFGLVPMYQDVQVTENWAHDGKAEPFFYYRIKCSLYRGEFLMGEGEGSCNSWESKYRYRNAERECPQCGKATIIKGKAEYGGGYLCYAKKGGCGAKFDENDPAIAEQMAGKVANPDIYDLVNTVLKMANKRAQIAATLNATGASRFFTQDVEDIPQLQEQSGNAADDHKNATVPKAKPKTQSAESAVPEELELVFAGIDRDVSRYAPQAYSVLAGAVTERLGEEKANALLDRMADDFEKRYPRGSSNPKVHKTQILAVWNEMLKAVSSNGPEGSN